MRLLILGSLGPYPERITTFTKAGNKVWYVCTQWLWDFADQHPEITCYNFIELGTTSNEAIEKLVQLIVNERIQAVYSILNVWDGSNTVTAALLEYGCPVPVIRHYKEHYHTPSKDERICIEQSTGVIFINEESEKYFGSIYNLPEQTTCVDADLIPKSYLSGTFQPKLSSKDDQVHLLIAGKACADGGRYDYRELITELTYEGAHVHLYGNFTALQNNGSLIDSPEVKALYSALDTSGRLHIHKPIPPQHFVEEWSRYDAGLLHVPRSDDHFRTQNLPNRYSAYIAAGIPVAIPDGAMPAMQQHLEEIGAGIIYKNIKELLYQLPNEDIVANLLKIRQDVNFEAVFPLIMEFITRCVTYNSFDLADRRDKQLIE